MTTPPLPPNAARVEGIEARATRSMYEAAALLPGNPFRIATAEVGGTIAVQTAAFPIGFLNRAIGLGTVRSATEDDVATLTAFYERAGIGQSMFQVVDWLQTPETTASLEAHGHRPGDAWVKLYHDFGVVRPVTTPVEFERIGPDRAGEWGEIVAEAFGMPREIGAFAAAPIGTASWTHYLGSLDGRPVHAAAMYVHEETAWLGFGATREDARGQGAQRRSFELRLRDAKAFGCTMVVTESGEETPEHPVNPSLRNMWASGFQLAWSRRNWVRGG